MPRIPAEKVMSSAKALIEFINASPSPYHVVDVCRKRLVSAGFTELSEKKSWSIAKGGKYFVTRNQSTLVAFTVGEKYETGNGFSIIGAHTDSPCLKLKPRSKRVKSGYLSVGVQCYGGGIWSTWFDRDLTIAGRVMIQNEAGHLEHRLMHVKKPILRVPMICIHLQRDLNDKFSINKETHTLPMMGTQQFEKELNKSTGGDVSSEKKDADAEDDESEASKHHSALVDLICKEIDCTPEQLVDLELVLADTQPAAIGGIHDEFVFAPRLDNLFNTYCALQGLLEATEEGAEEEKNVRMICLYDNEEVGSESAQGAASKLTELIMKRVCDSLGGQFEQTVANSFLLSADQGHAIHPNYPGKHEEDHQPKFHGGPILKINANQRYATTSITSSVIKILAKQCNVPLQALVVSNDSPCGSTIGPILSAKLGMRTVDLGGPTLSMHSCRETCCTTGVEQMIVLFRTFFRNFADVDANMIVE